MLQQILAKLEGATALDPISDRLQSLVQATIKPKAVRNLLHGTWLGHPLHPVLIHWPIGSFVGSAILDAVPGQTRAATTLITVGTVGALPTAVAGWTDWSTLSREKRRVGLLHATANVVAVGLYIGSLRARSNGNIVVGKALSYAGISVAGAGAYLGGHLTYDQGARVRRETASDPVTEPLEAPFTRS
jgi:uncharacterized membrane protein